MLLTGDGATCWSVMGPYLQDFSISIDDVNSDLNILLNALSSSLKVPSFQGEVQVVTDVA